MAYPTDTLYGLGADATSEIAVTGINKLKGRSGAPISIMVASPLQMLAMIDDTYGFATILVNAFLPGPLTLIGHTDYPVAESLRAEDDSVGFRCPDHDFCRRVTEAFGKPLTTTSVNPSGQIPAVDLDSIRTYFPRELDLIVDAGSIKGNAGSTIVDITTPTPRILRSGAIPDARIMETLN